MIVDDLGRAAEASNQKLNLWQSYILEHQVYSLPWNKKNPTLLG